MGLKMFGPGIEWMHAVALKPRETVNDLMDSLQARLCILGGSRLFAGLPSDALEVLALGMKQRRIAPGNTIFNRSDEGATLFGILAGQVRIVIGGSDGREQVLRMLGPGEMRESRQNQRLQSRFRTDLEARFCRRADFRGQRYPGHKVRSGPGLRGYMPD
jgi:Cyclic nucleotide-binding domain